MGMPDAPVVVVCGHYGAGKTNFAINLALDAAADGYEVTLADLDVVNPYFRSSDYRALLEGRGVQVVAPVMAGTTLDAPSISGRVSTEIEQAQASRLPLSAGACGPDGPAPEARLLRERMLVIDSGGDDAGATALGRFAPAIARGPYEMLYVVNARRNLTQQPEEAVGVLREIEAKARLAATAVVNNTHLKQDTDEAVVAAGVPFAREVARLANLPIACTTAPARLADRESALFGPNEAPQTLYPVQVYVRTPWE